jgi:uncharacterized protein YjiS (DUF1127 family)
MYQENFAGARRRPATSRALTVAELCSIGGVDRRGPRHEPFAPPLALLRRIGAFVRESRTRARSRDELLKLDDHMLKDIGVTRVDALYEARKPFWRP